ncbi:MAG: class I SAM-dependent methyltransferase [Pseudomonadota bacterium]
MSVIDVTADPNIAKQKSDTWSSYFRARRFAMIISQIEEISAKKGFCNIADIGGREEYWRPATEQLAACNARVSIINLENTTNVSGQRFEFRYGNACDLSDIKDGEFDLAHSNSLIEHVGDWSQMEACANEIRRVADSYYVQTPYFWFPLEPHFRTPFFHWLPEQVRARLIMTTKLGYIGRAKSLGQAMTNVQSCRLLDGLQFRNLFPDAEVKYERVAGLPKSLIAQRRGPSPANAQS